MDEFVDEEKDEDVGEGPIDGLEEDPEEGDDTKIPLDAEPIDDEETEEEML